MASFHDRFILDYTYIFHRHDNDDDEKKKRRRESRFMRGHVCLCFREYKTRTLQFVQADGSVSTTPYELDKSRLIQFSLFNYARREDSELNMSNRKLKKYLK